MNHPENELSYQQLLGIHSSLAATTLKHIKQHQLFEPLEYDPAKNPSQRLDQIHLLPAPSTHENNRALAEVANQGISQASHNVLQEQPAYMGALRYHLQDGNNLASLTTHQSIMDVALFQQAMTEQLNPDDDPKDWQNNHGLIISRGVSSIGAFGMAASEVAQKIGHVFQSFPRTDTLKNLDLPKNLIDENNSQLRREVKKWQGREMTNKVRHFGGKILHMAWEGTTTKISYGDDHQPENLVLGRISDGTIDLVNKSLVQPVVIWDGDEPVVEIGELTKVKNRQDVDRVQGWQRERLAYYSGVNPENVTVSG